MYFVCVCKGFVINCFLLDLLKMIEGDMDNIFVMFKVFIRGFLFWDDLRELICVWLVFRLDEGLGYVSYFFFKK